ncbi:MAG: hypothetical protein ACM3SQ_14930 [Betaproteobacteria bacterium]
MRAAVDVFIVLVVVGVFALQAKVITIVWGSAGDTWRQAISQWKRLLRRRAWTLLVLYVGVLAATLAAAAIVFWTWRTGLPRP